VSTAQLLAEAIDTLFVVCRAILAWIAAAAFVLTVCLFAGIAVIAPGAKGTRRVAWCGCRRVWRAVRGTWTPAGGPEGGSGLPGGLRAAPEPAEALSGRPGPSWARGDTDNQPEIEEAA
jgi:hypothetical protein